MNYLQKVNEWKNSSLVSESLKEELKKMSEEQIQEAFYTNLTFGTGGMRGIMGPGTNRMNIITIYKATLGFGNYLLKHEQNAKERGVVIAHDNRFNHDEFTMAAANILTTLGIKVYLFDALRPTPELSFAIRYLKAAGGINITASHNPKQYNGYKIYNSEGNQLILEQSNQVMDEIDKIDNELNIIIQPNEELITLLNEKIDEAYYQMVMSTSLNAEMKKDNITIVYTPQHGTGYIPVTTVMKRMGYHLIEVKEQCEPRGDFANTLSPNPEEKVAYDLALKYADQYHADLICCTDPDCDRIGIVLFDKDRNPIYMTGNQTGAILIEYLLSTRKAKHILPDNGIMYNTIVSSPLGAKVAALYGVETEQTLTGFKYIGDKIARSIENNGKVFQIGYEESYGYLINPQVRDKDGVQSAMLICEMASYYQHQGKTLLNVFEGIQQKLGYHIESQYSYIAEGMRGVEKIAHLMKSLRKMNLSEIAGEKVLIKEDYWTLIKEKNGVKMPLDYEQSDVLRYVFEDGSFVAIRPSGTEPKVKFYFALAGNSKENAQIRHDKVKNFILDLIH